MRGGKAFNIILGAIALLLFYMGLKYNPSFFSNLLNRSLPESYIWKVHAFNALCFASAILIIFFRKKIFEKRKELFLLITSLTLCFLLLEGAAGFWLCNFASDEQLARYAEYGQCGILSMYMPQPYLNFALTPNYKSRDCLNQHNSLGFRGKEITIPKPNNIFRIATIGGSTTYTTKVKNWKKAYPAQLESVLKEKGHNNIEVINAGVGSYNSWESLLNLQLKILDTQPDMLIIYHAVNDVHARLVNPDYYKRDGTGRRKQWEKPKYPLFIMKSTLVRMIAGRNPFGIDSFVSAPTSVERLKEEGFNQALNTTPLNAIEKNAPTYFEENLRSMITIALNNNISIMLATFDYVPFNTDYISSEHYRKAIEEHNNIIKRLGREYGLPVFDFRGKMPLDKSYWADGKHVTEKGARKKAELFADYIIKNKLILS